MRNLIGLESAVYVYRMDFFLMISFMDHIFKTRPILFHDIPLGLSREGHFNLLGMVRSANSSLERFLLSIYNRNFHCSPCPQDRDGGFCWMLVDSLRGRPCPLRFQDLMYCNPPFPFQFVGSISTMLMKTMIRW
jgi:hypothetical protein